MQCAVCQTVNPENAKFCFNCGAMLASGCPNCGTQNPPGAKFCFNCGFALAGEAASPSPVPTPVQPSAPSPSLQRYMPAELVAKMEAARAGRSMEGERRIVTILFCDVQGSTSIAEQLDPEEWAEIMNGAFERLIASVYRYEGTVARLMGDAILAFFGAPIAHEDDPRRAILAGLDIIEGIKEYRKMLPTEVAESFAVRVGINTGLVVVGEVGSDLRVEYTAMGDAVNVAARMEQTAAPGSIQIATNTHRLVDSLFEVETLSGVEIKGKTEPVLTYRVLGVREGALPRRGIEGLHSELVGRDAELEAVLSSVEALLAVQGGIVSVIGEAGLGKSRLVAEARQSSRDLPVRWLEARSFSYETSIPYTQFASLVSGFADLLSSQDDRERYRRLRDAVSAVMPADVVDVAPYLASMLRIDVPGAEGEMVRHLEPPLLRGRVFAAVSRFLAALAEQQPLVLLFEDLHWADATSLELLRHILPLTEQQPILVLALFRPHREDSSWQFHELAEREYVHRYRSVHLKPLDAGQSRTLVANLLHIEDLPERVRALILQKAEGNPFFVEEVIRSLLDSGLVVHEDGHWRATREIENVKVPDTLAGVITARLDRIEGEPKRVAQAASVIGREFAADILSDVYEEPESIDPALNDLQRRELVLQREVAARQYAFKHVLTQETAYASILLSRRRELHRRAGECLERVAPDRVTDIARHFMEAREEVRALPYIVAAGEQAARAYASDTAIRHFREAIRILPQMENVDLMRRTYEGLGKALELTNDAQGALDTYSRMNDVADSLGDVPAKVSALNKRAFVLAFMLQRMPEAMQDLDAAEHLARQEKDARGLVESATLRCGTCLPAGNFSGAVNSLGSSTDVARQKGLKSELATGLAHSALTFTFMTRFDDAWEAGQEGLRIAEELGKQEEIDDLMTFVVPFHYIREGDLDAAYHAALEGVTKAERIGDYLHVCQGAYVLGVIEQARGNYEASMRWLQKMLATAEIVGPRVVFFVAMGLGVLGCVAMLIGPDVYQETMAPHFPTLEAIADFGGATTWTDLGFCALDLGDVARAEELFQKAITFPSMPWLLEKPRALSGLAVARLMSGDLTGAAELVQEARAYAEQHGMQFMLPIVANVEGLIAMTGGDTSQALDRFLAAERAAIGTGMRPFIWTAQAGAAQALAAMGRHDEAESQRRKALDVIDEMAGLFDNESLRATFRENATRKVTSVGKTGDPVR